jgi:hypothetical protein
LVHCEIIEFIGKCFKKDLRGLATNHIILNSNQKNKRKKRIFTQKFAVFTIYAATESKPTVLNLDFGRKGNKKEPCGSL